MNPATARGLRIFVLPAALAGAAVGFHFATQVPRGEVEPRASEPAPAATPRPSSRVAFKARRPVRLQELRRRFAGVGFEEEPVHEPFARAHEGLISQLVAKARKEAFRGAPESPQVETSVECRTIRCRVDVCSAFPPELDLLTSTLQAMRLAGEPLFERLDVEPTTRGALSKEPEHEPCYRLVVVLSRDLPSLADIRFGDAHPAEPPEQPRND